MESKKALPLANFSFFVMFGLETADAKFRALLLLGTNHSALSSLHTNKNVIQKLGNLTLTLVLQFHSKFHF